MEPKIVISTVASNDYLIYLERLLASARINLPEALFHVVLVNVDELKDPYIRSLNSNVEINHEFVQFNTISEKRGYCANRRGKLFPKLMKNYNCPIVWVDVDSLIVNEANELLDYASKFDLSVDYSSGHISLTASKRKFKKLPKGPLGTPYFGVFNTSVITTNNSAVAKEFFLDYEKKVNLGPLDWYTDQEGLFLTFKKFENRINFHPLEERFCSRVNNPGSIIWTLKGSMKDEEDYILKGDSYIFKIKKWTNTIELSKVKTNVEIDEKKGRMKNNINKLSPLQMIVISLKKFFEQLKNQ